MDSISSFPTRSTSSNGAVTMKIPDAMSTAHCWYMCLSIVAVYSRDSVVIIYTDFHATRSSFSKQPPDPAQDTVLLWIVWVVLAGDLKYCRECVCEGIYLISYPLCNLAIASKSANVQGHCSYPFTFLILLQCDVESPAGNTGRTRCAGQSWSVNVHAG